MDWLPPVADIPSLAAGGGAALAIAILGWVGRLLFFKPEYRNRAASANKEAQDFYQEALADQNRRIEQLRKETDRELSRLRDELRETTAAHDKTLVLLAESRQAYSDLDARTSKERHGLRDLVDALREENVDLKYQLATMHEEIRQLKAEIATLRAQTGVEGRRKTDGF